MKEQNTLPDVVVLVQMSPVRWHEFLNGFGGIIGADWATPATEEQKKLVINVLASMANALAKVADQNPYCKVPEDSIRALAFTGSIGTGGFQFYSAQQN
jgi:hypothetical protein